MDYDYNLIEIDKSDDGGFSVFATSFIKKYWGAGVLGEVVRVAKDPRVIPILKSGYSDKGASLLQKEFGKVLVEHLTHHTKKTPYNYDLIRVEDIDGHAVVDTSEFLDAYTKGDDLRIDKDVQMRIDALVREPFSDDVVRKIKKFLGDAFVASLSSPEAKYAIHSTVRGRGNRLARAQAPTHARFKQHVLPDQRRLIRNRPVLITETELFQHLDSLLEQQKTHLLEVRTEDGRPVDLELVAKQRRVTRVLDERRQTVLEEAIAPAAPRPLAPHPILDSVGNDRPTGIAFPRIPGGKVLDKTQISQIVEGMASIDGELQVDEKTGAVTVAQGGPKEPAVEVEEPELPHDPADVQDATAEVAQDVEEEEEVEELPPGIPQPPPPPGGQPRPSSKKKHRR